MEIKYMEASLNDVMQFWVKEYELPKDKYIYDFSWTWNPEKDRVVFRVFVADK